MSILRELEHPVAIAMWDFGWLLRHYEGGGFENWDEALDGLVERGYNAIRIDCFPHLVSSDKWEEFDFRYDPKTCSMWHHQQDTRVNVRAALKEFLPKCFARGIYVGLSTWIQWPEQRPLLMDKQDLINAWEKTLEFLRDNDLLHNILYVDFLNEYPYCHGFAALKRHAQQLDGRDVTVTETNMQDDVENGFLENGKKYMKAFSRELVEWFSPRWPGIDFGVCVTTFGRIPEHMETTDFAAQQFLDLHLWVLYRPGGAKYQDFEATVKTPEQMEELYRMTREYYDAEKDNLEAFMERELTKHEQMSREYNAPVGNTEGWGYVNYPEDATDWDFNKWAAEMCVDMSIRHNFSFICTTNFTHPYVKPLWNDVEWHKQLTAKIRNATVDRFWLEK